MAHAGYLTSCLLGFHGLFLCLLLLSLAHQASAQPNDDQTVERLLAELSTGDVRGNPFKLFIQRAQLIITGLMHISILLLPKYSDASPADAKDRGNTSNNNNTNSNKSGHGAAAFNANAGPSSSNGAANNNNSGGGGASGSRGSKASAGTKSTSSLDLKGLGTIPVPGFPADGSDLDTWQSVQRALQHTAASGLDWDNCCIYKLDQTGGAVIQAAPPYPVSTTAAYYAAKIKKDALICNNYEKGPHFSDWEALHAAGATSMTSVPMFSEDQLIGVLNLASTEPHAFAKNRVIWLLALALSPFAAGLRYTTKALQVDAFVKRIMPSLLEQNYVRNLTAKLPTTAPSSSRNTSNSTGINSPRNTTTTPAAAATTTTVAGQGDGRVNCTSSSSSATSTGKGKSSATLQSTTITAAGTETHSNTSSPKLPSKLGARAGGAGDGVAIGSDQFAEQAEVMITSSPTIGGLGVATTTTTTATTTGTVYDSTMNIPVLGSGGKTTYTSETNGNNYPTTVPNGVHARQTINHANGKHSTPNGSVPLAGVKPKQLPVKSINGASCIAAAMHSGSLNDDNKCKDPATSPGVIPAHHGALTSSTTVATHPVDGSDADLDWGDFMFNLVSMCIVYAYFSEAAVGGESQAAVVASMCIAAVDIALLALRWLWYEQYITHGGAVLQIFQMYRVIVLPVANTWMSWSLLNKLGLRPGRWIVSSLGGLIVGLLAIGTQVRSFLHAPLQLASVLFAAASTTDLCTSLFGGAFGFRCMGAMSLLQLSIGVVVPSLLVHVLEMRSSAQKPYLPHVQAKRWLLHG